MKPEGLMEAITELSHERGLDPEAIIEAIEDAIVGAAYRKYKNYRNIEAVLNPDTGDVDLMHYKVAVEEVNDPDNEISLEQVQKMDPDAELGDEVEYEIDSKEFKGVIAQTARQLIYQKIREAERESVLDKYRDKKGEIIHGSVSRIERGRVIITVGNTTEAVLEYREQIPFEKLQTGESVRALLLDLQSDGKGPQLFVSRTHPNFLKKLFEVEVPEVYDGIIDIIAAAREPGKRAKVAVYTNDSDIDPVGACVGMRGSRVQAIVSELCGERIDVVEWSENLEQFISNALAPADLMDIDLNEEKKEANITIVRDQLSLAIGKQGQNVRLASKLTGIMININPWDPDDALKSDDEELSDDETSEEEDDNEESADLSAEASLGNEKDETLEETESVADLIKKIDESQDLTDESDDENAEAESKEESIAEEEVLIDEEPLVEEEALTDEEPAVEEVTEEEPIVEEATVTEEESIVEEATVTEAKPVVEEATVTEAKPVVEEEPIKEVDSTEK